MNSYELWFIILIITAKDAFGLQTGNTVVSSYLVDNYPEHANEVITFYAVILNVLAPDQYSLVHH